jgi:hypothetical protein
MTGLDKLARARTFFLAGTMQGSRGGSDMVDQGYRREMREIILAYRPDAEIRDPGDLMAQWLLTEADEIRAAHADLAGSEFVLREELSAPLVRLTDVFDRLVELSGESDVCLAWLPGHEASMGTAAEMWAAHANGRCVVAVTQMRQNLAVLSCSDVIVPGLDDLAALLGVPYTGASHVRAR